MVILLNYRDVLRNGEHYKRAGIIYQNDVPEGWVSANCHPKNYLRPKAAVQTWVWSGVSEVKKCGRRAVVLRGRGGWSKTQILINYF